MTTDYISRSLYLADVQYLVAEKSNRLFLTSVEGALAEDHFYAGLSAEASAAILLAPTLDA